MVSQSRQVTTGCGPLLHAGKGESSQLRAWVGKCWLTVQSQQIIKRPLGQRRFTLLAGQILAQGCRQIPSRYYSSISTDAGRLFRSALGVRRAEALSVASY